jgi:formylglycine-generating enzyme required for sulfatase activity
MASLGVARPSKRSPTASIERLQRGISYTALSEYGEGVRGIRELSLVSARESLTALAESLAAEGHVRELGTLITHIEQTQNHFSGHSSWGACAALVAEIARRIYPTKLPVQPVNMLRYFRTDDNRAYLSVGAFPKVPVRSVVAAAEAVDLFSDLRLKDKEHELWATLPGGWFKFKLLPQRRSVFDSSRGRKLMPPRKVRLTKFQIGRYLVTVRDYQRFVESGGYSTEKHWSLGGFGDFREPGEWQYQRLYPTRPVVNVSWYEAAAYAKSVGARLPTEAEWERAARGKKDRKYPWGDDPPTPQRLNFARSKISSPTPVGIYEQGATPEGIFDMAGNVSEWCADSVERFRVRGPQLGSERTHFRVTRGGAFCDDGRFVGASPRVLCLPIFRARSVGFRLAR